MKGVITLKRNKAMRAAGVLLIATLLSTSAVSGTYAKYVSKGSASDTARTAKWGVVISGSGNLFSKNYLKADNNTPTLSISASEISVESSNADMLVAPGTKSAGSGLALSITGTPEVDTRVKTTIEAKDVYLAAGTYALMKQIPVTSDSYATLVESGLYTKSDSTYTKLTDQAFSTEAVYYVVDTETNAVVPEGGYYPVQFSYSGDTTAKTAVKVAEAVAKKFSSSASASGTNNTANGLTSFSTSKAIDSNTSLADALGLSDVTIGWEWAYHNSIDTAWDNVDYEDTILGDLAAGTEVVAVGTNDATVLTVNADTGIVKSGDTTVGCIKTTFNITIEAVQID